MRDEDKKMLGNFVQVGDGPQVDPEELDAKIRLFIDLANALDNGEPSVVTAVAFASLKLLCEQRLGFQVEVGVRSFENKTREEVEKEIKEEYAESGRIRPFPLPVQLILPFTEVIEGVNIMLEHAETPSQVDCVQFWLGQYLVQEFGSPAESSED